MSTIHEYASLKTSPVKLSEINWTKEKRVHIHMHLVSMWHCLVKTFPRKIQWDTNLNEGKRVQYVNLLMTCSPGWYKLYFQHVTSLRWRIPILCISFLNVDVGNAFVNRSARFSLDIFAKYRHCFSYGAHVCRRTSVKCVWSCLL